MFPKDYFIPIFRASKKYKFETFYHPYVSAFIKALYIGGIDGLLQRPLQLWPENFMLEPFDFKSTYDPAPIVMNDDHYPDEDVDFSTGGSYALYNWELFFHVPFLIANQLTQNQHFEEAQRWFHYIFDPTDTSMLPSPDRYWKTKPFFENKEPWNERIQRLLRILAEGEKGDKQYDELKAQVQQWRENPFNPHLIARLRITAYQKRVVMKYIDNLIAWGDNLFRRDTMESINEATQLYILAAELLGERPEEIPQHTDTPIHTYETLKNKLDPFSNALIQSILVNIEEFVKSSSVNFTRSRGKGPSVTLPTTLYFCVPKNDKLLGYWDTVEDRLFKIRHCMNIEGVVRQLPLFAPPIDPGLLVKAAAAGIDINSALNDVNAPLPHYRFNVMVQKAIELIAEVKSLGSSLLSALEKRDAEKISLIRAKHEINLFKLVEQIKKDHIEELKENAAAIEKSPRRCCRQLHTLPEALRG